MTASELGAGASASWAADGVMEIYLAPGGFFFGKGHRRIRTVLGSCVAIILWHPVKCVGGMCHYLLPRGVRKGGPEGVYAVDAMDLFLREVRGRVTVPREYVTTLVGGGRMFADLPFNVPGNNVEAGRTLLQDYGFVPPAEHVGGTGHRQVTMELWSGRVSVSHIERAVGET